MFSRAFCKVFKNTLLTENNCMKNAQILSFFWFVFSCIWTEYGNLSIKISVFSSNMGKCRPEKTLYLDNFYSFHLRATFFKSPPTFTALYWKTWNKSEDCTAPKVSKYVDFSVFSCIRTRKNSLFGVFPRNVGSNSGGLWSLQIIWNRAFTTEAFLEICFVSLPKRSKILLPLHLHNLVGGIVYGCLEKLSLFLHR